MIASPGFALAARIVAALSMTAAFVALVVPPAANATPVAPLVSSADVAPIPSPRPADDAVRTVIAQNIFSATRRAPTQRWSPPGLETAPPPISTNVPTATSDGVESGDPTADPVPALYGTVIGEGPRRALLRLSARDIAPRLLAVGERQGGWQVVQIDSARVVLRSSMGTRTVRLLRAGADR
jgi:hypothetical protein